MSSSLDEKFACDNCGRRYSWKPHIAGKSARCKCGHVLRVPDQLPVASPEVTPTPAATDQPASPAPPAVPTVQISSYRLANLPHRARIDEVSDVDDITSVWKGWLYLLAGIVVGGLAVYMYIDLTAFEQEGGIRIMRRWIAFAYDFGGKWGVVGLLGAISILSGMFGVLMIKGRIVLESD